METDSNLLFNFHVGENRVHRQKIVVRGKTVRERSKNRKQLKQAELLRSKEINKSQSGKSSANNLSQNNPIIVSQNKTVSSGKKQSCGITSSLFTKNPEIPKVDNRDILPVVENVFSNKNFSSMDNLHPHMIKNLETRIGINTMTEIQYYSIPAVLKCERDILVQAQTGSGKTLAYAIPIVNHLQSVRPLINRSDGTYAIIIVPTRELAIQSFECFQKLVYPFTWVVPGCLMGGEKRKAEKARIRKGINILISTPGRLQDHLNKTESLNLSKVKWIVIDEADRLLDLGYEKSLQEILAKISDVCNSKHHTILLSATLSSGVERLAGMSLTNPLHLRVSEESTGQNRDAETFAIPESLEQKYSVVPMKLRLVTLYAFIMDKFSSSQKTMKMIVFLSTQVSVDFHCDVFKSVICRKVDNNSGLDMNSLCCMDDVKAYKLHGEMPQAERTEAFQEFIQTKSGVLFCTDVAARGLHLPKVKWIIQYTAPPSCSEYIHRIGRTARAGMKGHSLLFLLPSEADYVTLLNERQIRLEQVDMYAILERLILTEGIRKPATKPLHNQTITQNATYLQNACEEYILRSNNTLELAGKACLSFIRGYSTYPKSVKHIFSIKNLHLGHVAKSFALRQAPKGLGQKYGTHVENKSRPVTENRAKKRKIDPLLISEFSDGGVLLPKRKK